MHSETLSAYIPENPTAHGVIGTPRYDIVASGSIVGSLHLSSNGGAPVFTTKVLPQPLIENYEHFWTFTASPTTR